MNDELVAVVGLGFLGRGIAASLLMHGYRVLAFEQSIDRLNEAEASVAEAISEAIDHGASPAALAVGWRDRYRSSMSIEELAAATFVIESITEDANIKSQAFDEIERVVGPKVPIASNTSAIPISAMQQARRHPGRFLGMHWAEPAHATRFMELIRGDQTQDAAFEQATTLAIRCGKEPCVIAQDIPGFIANRLGYAVYREAMHLVSEGVADFETVDRSFRNSIGLWATLCGPFRWMDLTGGPALYGQSMQPVLPTLNSARETPQWFEEMRRNSARGIANGEGFFNYTPIEAKDWEERYRKHAWAIKQLVDEARPMKE